MEIAHSLRNPGSVGIRTHGQLEQQIIQMLSAAAVQVDGDLLSGGSPEAEHGFGGGPLGTQVAAVVGILFFEGMARVEIVHSDGYSCQCNLKNYSIALSRSKEIMETFPLEKAIFFLCKK